MRGAAVRTAAFSAALAGLLVATPCVADGPGAYRPRERASRPAVALTAELKAIDAYNTGFALIQRADHHEALAAAATSEAERDTARRDGRKAYETSLRHFSDAVRLDPSMHEAFTYLGYASRKLGRHSDALESYAQALRLNPDYPHAIEYQGQAFLGLNRIDEAKFNYLRLYALNQAQAHKLLRAMRAWTDEHAAAPPAGVDVAGLQTWIVERERSHDPNEPASSW